MRSGNYLLSFRVFLTYALFYHSTPSPLIMAELLNDNHEHKGNPLYLPPLMDSFTLRKDYAFYSGFVSFTKMTSIYSDASLTSAKEMGLL